MFSHCSINFVVVGSAYFFMADLISWEFGCNLCEFFFMLVCLGTCICEFCYMEGQGMDLCVLDAQFFEMVFIIWEFGWYLCDFFVVLVCLGTSICKFWSIAVILSVKLSVMVCIWEWMLSFMVWILERRWSNSDFGRDDELGDLAGKIASDCLHVMDLYCVFLEGVIVRNIYWLGLLFYLYIIYL